MSLKCQKPVLCKKKHERWKANQKYFIPIGEREHSLFLEHLENKKAKLTIGYHGDRRQFERVINIHDIRDVIKYGWVIERNFFSDVQAATVIIHGYTKKYRPINIVCIVLAEDHWEVKTVYNPESMKHKWSKDFQERICFCKDEKL